MLTLDAAEHVFGVPPIAAAVSALRVTDRDGAAATASQTVATGDEPRREWVTARAMGRDVTVRYRVAVAPMSLGGPPFALKPSGGGVTGSMVGFFLAPKNVEVPSTTLDWDLRDLPAGSIGVSGPGRGRVVIPGPVGDLVNQWVLAGPALRLFPDERRGFNAYALGAMPVVPRTFLGWADRAYAALVAAFGDRAAPHYELFVRTVPGASLLTGTASNTVPSALVTLGTTFRPDEGMDQLEMVTLHEMTHRWVGHLEPNGSWFTEGLTVYLSIRTGCDTGLISAAGCAAEINVRAEKYYRSRARHMPEAAIEQTTFADEFVRQVPYGRGMLYFAAIDAQIRSRSGGRFTLLTALKPILRTGDASRTISLATFEAMLAAHLGAPAVVAFRRTMIDGADDPVAPSDGFGARFVRVAETWDTPRGAVRGFSWRPTP